MRRIFSVAVATIAALALAACAGAPASTMSQEAPAAQPAAPAITAGDLSISDPWVRPVSLGAPADAPMPEGTAGAMGGMEMSGVNTAGYMTIRNSGAEADYLIGATASSDLVGVVELHTVIEEGGAMRMRPVDRIEVPANGEVTLQPGGFHVMFIGVKQELNAGDMVTVSLTFEKAGTVELDAVVRPADAMP